MDEAHRQRSRDGEKGLRKQMKEPQTCRRRWQSTWFGGTEGASWTVSRGQGWRRGSIRRPLAAREGGLMALGVGADCQRLM